MDLVGRFRLGIDFSCDGNLLMSAKNFADYFGYRNPGDPLQKVDLGVVHCKPADVQAVKDRLEDWLDERHATDQAQRVVVMTRQEFIEREKRFWARSTPIGVIFFVGVAMGFAVGMITCYHVVSTDINDHLNEFATLRAMGYSNLYFIGLFFRFAFYLAVLGFIPGILLSQVLFVLISQQTGLVMTMTIGRASLVLVLTILMCIASSLLALRRLLSADPASLF